jgi:hypothetical protein
VEFIIQKPYLDKTISRAFLKDIKPDFQRDSAIHAKH